MTTEGSDMLRRSAQDQAAAIREGRLTAEALMEATLARVAEVNPVLNAIVSLREREALLAEARSADQATDRGPLHGLPIAIKDLVDAAGLPTTQGSPLYADHVPDQDCLYVARLRAAGAIVIGKTNTPEFGLGSNTYNPVHGRTANPFDQSRTCGGSSGGAAVALATGMLSIADGSDAMGSLRNPAGWCNVYGHRPSWGRVPADAAGDMFLHRLSTDGPMARCPGDMAMLLDVMSGPVKGSPHGRGFAPVGALDPTLRGKRIAWLGDWGGLLPIEDGILALCEAALAVFEAQGAVVERIDPPFDRDAIWESWTTLRSWSNAARLGPFLADERAQHLKPEAIWEAERGLALTGPEIQRASELRSDWYRQAEHLFDSYDAMALPTAQVWPFSIEADWPKEIAGQQMDTYHRWMEGMIPASLLGLPATAVPAGFGEHGLPMGLQLVGRAGNDAGVLGLAEGYHRETEWPQRHAPSL